VFAIECRGVLHVISFIRATDEGLVSIIFLLIMYNLSANNQSSSYNRRPLPGGSRDVGDFHKRRRSRSRSNERNVRRRSPSRSRERHDQRSSSQEVSNSKSIEELELLELTRDARTIFVSQLVVRATEEQVKEFFEQIGQVEDVKLIRDKFSNKSKGFGYVEFSDIDSIPKALLLNGQKFCMKHNKCSCSGFPIAIKTSQAEKNYAAQAEAVGGSTSQANLEKRIYINNLDPKITESDLKAVASLIGPIEKLMIIRNSHGKSYGFAYVQFHDVATTNKALSSLHKIELANKPIQVGKLNILGEVICPDNTSFLLQLQSNSSSSSSSLTPQARASLMAQLSNATSQAVQQLSTSVIAAASMPGVDLPSLNTLGNVIPVAASNTPVAPGVGFVDPIAAAAALAATSALAGTLPATSLVTSHATPNLAEIPIDQLPTPCLVLKNLFNLQEELENDASHTNEWQEEIKADVLGEVSKYCQKQVLHFHLDTGDLDGAFYLAFSTTADKESVLKALTGRSFGGRPLHVVQVPLMEYIANFPDAVEAMSK
jgi:RNA-binding protein 23/39